MICTLFFIFFGTRLLIDTAYLTNSQTSDSSSLSDSAASDNTGADVDTENANTSSDNNSENTNSSENTTKRLQEEQTKNLPDRRTDSISIPGVKSITIPKNISDVNVDLYNPAKNNCFFEISIVLKDGNKQIYKSDLVKPGQHIYSINLSEALP
ncbi:MAG: hypothetical protein LIO43_03630 [Clostridiales bacterium]|nr:hypothetical protein [Clostridiales bacterium]